jgi:hypothetical protein
MIFRGDSFIHISEKYDCTRQTVRNRWKDFKEKVLEVGLLEAANEIGVHEEVEKLRTIAGKIAREETSLDDCLTGSKVSTHLLGLDLDIEDFERFLVDLYKNARTQEVSGEQLGNLAHKLHMESIQSDLGYVELTETIKMLHSDKENTEKTINEQKEAIKQNQDELAAKLLEADVTDETLNKYLMDKAILEENDLKVEDIQKTAHFIKELKNHEFDSVRVNELVNKHDSIQVQIRYLETNQTLLVEENNQIKTKTSSLYEQVRANEARIQVLTKQQEKLQEPINAVMELIKQKIYQNDIVTLKELVGQADVSFEELKSTLETLGTLKAVRDEKKKKNEDLESQSIVYAKIIGDLKQDIAVLKNRKNTLHNDIENILTGFEYKLKTITGTTVKELQDPEKGIRANVIRSIDQSLIIAETHVNNFEKESNEKMDQMIRKAEATNTRISEFEEKIARYSVELGQYKALENLSKLFLGNEIPRGTKLLIIASTLELLENALNYEGLSNEANSLRQVKENVFRRG